MVDFFLKKGGGYLVKNWKDILLFSFSGRRIM